MCKKPPTRKGGGGLAGGEALQGEIERGSLAGVKSCAEEIRAQGNAVYAE